MLVLLVESVCMPYLLAVVDYADLTLVSVGLEHL